MTGWGIDRSARRVAMPRARFVAALIGATLAAAWSPVQAQSQPQNGPTSLLPAPADTKPPAASPAPAAAAAPAPASTPPGDNPVQVQELGNVDFNGFGTQDEIHGGFPMDLWSGSDPAFVTKALGALGPSASRPLESLIRRALLSVTTATGAKAGDNAFLVARARALWAIGDTDDLVLLLKSVPLPAVTPPLRRLLADAALLAGDNPTACAQAAPMAAASGSDPYPVELRIFCQLANGQAGQASLGIDVLREQGVTDPPFFLLADTLSVGGTVPRGGVANPSPLILAMGRLAKAEQPAPGPDATPAVLHAIALATGTPLEIRLAAGERAEAVGALDTDTLRRLAESVPFTADDLNNAEAKAAKDGPARGRALLLQAAERQVPPLAKAGLMAHALAPLQGQLYFVQARLLAPQIAAMQPTSDINLFVPALTRALLAARQLDAARNWAGWIRSGAATDKSLADAAAGMAVVAHIAKLDDTPLTAEAIEAWRKAPGTLAADRAARRAALGPALLAALGEPVPPEVALAQLEGAPQPAAQAPNPILMLNLDAAAAAKRKGETLLLAYLAAGDGSWTQLDVATIVHLVATLKASGFEDEARALALEAAIANGV